jgi:transposase
LKIGTIYGSDDHMRQNDSRNLKLEALNERRRQVVECRKRGMTQEEVSALIGMSTVTIGKIDKLYREGGLKAVEVVKEGRPVGKGRILTSEQERDAQRLIMDRTPDQLKLPYALWTREAVGEMIQRRYQRKLTVRSVGNYLKRWGYTPQKPLQKAYEQRPEEVRKWEEERFPALKERAMREGADILWGDETGLRSDDVRGRSYSLRGKTPVVRVNHNRDGCSVISTVTNKGQMRWMVFKGALNSKLFIAFLRRLVKDAKRKVFLILDNLKVHHSRPVKQWVEEHHEQIELFFLPSYSPELNPVEVANADLKHGVTTHAPARKKGQLQKLVAVLLRQLQNDPDRIVSFFQKDTVRYAA